MAQTLLYSKLSLKYADSEGSNTFSLLDFNASDKQILDLADSINAFQQTAIDKVIKNLSYEIR